MLWKLMQERYVLCLCTHTRLGAGLSCFENLGPSAELKTVFPQMWLQGRKEGCHLNHQRWGPNQIPTLEIWVGNNAGKWAVCEPMEVRTRSCVTGNPRKMEYCLSSEQRSLLPLKDCEMLCPSSSSSSEALGFTVLRSGSQMNPLLRPHKPRSKEGLSQDVLDCLGLAGDRVGWDMVLN